MSENKNINQEIIEEEYMLGKEYYSKRKNKVINLV